MRWLKRISRRMFGGSPLHEAAGGGRRSFAWLPANPGAVAALMATQTELRTKSRDLVRRNAWANAALESYVANAIGTGIKPQSLVADAALRERIQMLWRDWTLDADASGLTDFYGLQALACRAMLEGGEALVRIRYRRPEDGLFEAGMAGVSYEKTSPNAGGIPGLPWEAPLRRYDNQLRNRDYGGDIPTLVR
jgi:capsid protein